MPYSMACMPANLGDDKGLSCLTGVDHNGNSMKTCILIRTFVQQNVNLALNQVVWRRRALVAYFVEYRNS